MLQFNLIVYSFRYLSKSCFSRYHASKICHIIDKTLDSNRLILMDQGVVGWCDGPG